MKKILITGANSYIGTSFEKYIKENYPDEYVVDTVDMIDGTWREKNFSEYDSVFHVAGIAHQKETKQNAPLYYQVNRDLAIETAQKAKSDGVKQFIFLSSMSVYGMDTGVITKDTAPNPKSNYGKSKLQAEEGINALVDDEFKVCIVRPPMVYGRGCKGNFQTVCKLVRKSPVFPRVHNQRSMIYIDNLCAFVKICVDRSLRGLYLPQNREYVKTSDMAKVIADVLQKKLWLSGFVGVVTSFIRPFVSMAKKAFGNLLYQDVENLDFEYCIVDNMESFRLSVE
jgi:UDP-glucose 4-epimerase